MRRRLLAAALLPAAALTGGAAGVERLEIDVAQVRSGHGLIRLCLTADPKNFPACHDDARAMRRNYDGRQRRIVIEGLPLGDYAFAVIHDENSNHKLDTIAGIPREGFGFSRNPAIGFGPPRFSAARFTLDGQGDATAQQVRMRYFL
jgi:uncharacterized protein (DUF2141 family)